MANQTSGDSKPKWWQMGIAILMPVLFFGVLGFLEVTDKQKVSTRSGCVVSEMELKDQRRNLPILIVSTSCGEFSSYNVAHRVLIKEGNMYDFVIRGEGVFNQRPRIDKVIVSGLTGTPQI